MLASRPPKGADHRVEGSSVSSPHQPSWERLLAWLVVGAISLNVLAAVLPHLLVPIVVLAGVVAVLRLVFFHTRKW